MSAYEIVKYNQIVQVYHVISGNCILEKIKLKFHFLGDFYVMNIFEIFGNI